MDNTNNSTTFKMDETIDISKSVPTLPITLENNFIHRINGFGCASEKCKNSEAMFGTTYLPYCNSQFSCMLKNIEYLVLENAKQKAQIESLSSLISIIKPVSSYPQKMDISSEKFPSYNVTTKVNKKTKTT